MKVSLKRTNGDSWELDGTPEELSDFVTKHWFGFFSLGLPAPIQLQPAPPCGPLSLPWCPPLFPELLPFPSGITFTPIPIEQFVVKEFISGSTIPAT